MFKSFWASKCGCIVLKALEKSKNISLTVLPVLYFHSKKILQESSSASFPHLSPPGNRRCDVLGFAPTGSVLSSSTLEIFRKASPDVRVALPASLSAQSFPFTPACPGQYTHRCFRRGMSTIDIFQSVLPIPRFTFFQQAHWICEDDGMCGPTVTTWGKPAESMGDWCMVEATDMTTFINCTNTSPRCYLCTGQALHKPIIMRTRSIIYFQRMG